MIAKKPTLYILSGLPGSGKSTLAKLLAQKTGAAHIRIDTLEQGLRDLCKMSKVEGEGYGLAYALTVDILASGCSVVADSVNPIPLTRNAWMKVATSNGANFINVEIICSDKDEHRHRLQTRDDGIPGLRRLTWEEVQSRDYREWDVPRIKIDTAGKSTDESLRELHSAFKL